MFRGHHEHNIDSKGRVSVPSKFRDVLAVKYDGNIVVTRSGQSLVAYPISEWNVIEEKLLAAPQFKAEVKRIKRYMISAAVECTIDKQGRILIPAKLREHAEIGKEVVFVGVLNKFEIWSKELFEKVDEADKNSFEDDCDVLSEFGIG